MRPNQQRGSTNGFQDRQRAESARQFRKTLYLDSKADDNDPDSIAGSRSAPSIQGEQMSAVPKSMHKCHCGQHYHPTGCNNRCPYCFCPITQVSVFLCPDWKRKDEERRKLFLAAQPPPETKEQRIARQVRQGSIVEGCKGCEIFFDNPDAFAPRHKASDRCRSGKRSHCTCDTCF